MCWGVYWVCVLRVCARWGCNGRVLGGVLGVCWGCAGGVLGVCWVCVLGVCFSLVISLLCCDRKSEKVSSGEHKKKKKGKKSCLIL